MHESFAHQAPSLPHPLNKLKQWSCLSQFLPMSLTQSWTKRAVGGGGEAGGDSRQRPASDIRPSCENCTVAVRPGGEQGLVGGVRGEWRNRESAGRRPRREDGPAAGGRPLAISLLPGVL